MSSRKPVLALKAGYEVKWIQRELTQPWFTRLIQQFTRLPSGQG